jgi:hypothetical protein
LRIAPFVSRRAISDLEIDDVAAASVHEMMGRPICGKACAHAGAKDSLAAVCYERGLALQYVYEFVLFAVAVKQSGLGAGRQSCEVDAKILQSENVSQSPFLASGNSAEKRLGIIRTLCAGRNLESLDGERRD